MFSLTIGVLLASAFVFGYICDRCRVKIAAWAERRAKANELKAAQLLVDQYEKAKAVIASHTPPFPPKPQV
jgi:hypothetical protein